MSDFKDSKIHGRCNIAFYVLKFLNHFQEMKEILKIRATDEGIELDSNTLSIIVKIAKETSLRYCIGPFLPC